MTRAVIDEDLDRYRVAVMDELPLEVWGEPSAPAYTPNLNIAYYKRSLTVRPKDGVPTAIFTYAG